MLIVLWCIGEQCSRVFYGVGNQALYRFNPTPDLFGFSMVKTLSRHNYHGHYLRLTYSFYIFLGPYNLA